MGKISNHWCDTRPNIICLEGNGSRPSHFGSGYAVSETMYTLNQTEVHSVCYVMLESNPSDCRYNVDDSGVCQTLKERMGTGGEQRAFTDRTGRE